MSLAIEWNITKPEIYLVSQRKYNLDPQRPLWQKMFFRLVYLPVVRFAFNHANICAPSAMDTNGRIELIEQQGVFFDESVAQSQVRDGNYSVKPISLNYEVPPESFRTAGHVTPLAEVPDRFSRRPPQAVLVYPKEYKALECMVNRVVTNSREATVS